MQFIAQDSIRRKLYLLRAASNLPSTSRHAYLSVALWCTTVKFRQMTFNVIVIYYSKRSYVKAYKKSLLVYFLLWEAIQCAPLYEVCSESSRNN
jgi:hypothetical protein